MPLMTAEEAGKTQCRMVPPIVLQSAGTVINSQKMGIKMEFPNCAGPKCALWAWALPEHEPLPPEGQTYERRGHCGMVQHAGS